MLSQRMICVSTLYFICGSEGEAGEGCVALSPKNPHRQLENAFHEMFGHEASEDLRKKFQEKTWQEGIGGLKSSCFGTKFNREAVIFDLLKKLLDKEPTIRQKKLESSFLQDSIPKKEFVNFTTLLLGKCDANDEILHGVIEDLQKSTELREKFFYKEKEQEAGKSSKKAVAPRSESEVVDPAVANLLRMVCKSFGMEGFHPTPDNKFLGNSSLSTEGNINLALVVLEHAFGLPFAEQKIFRETTLNTRFLEGLTRVEFVELVELFAKKPGLSFSRIFRSMFEALAQSEKLLSFLKKLIKEMTKPGYGNRRNRADVVKRLDALEKTNQTEEKVKGRDYVALKQCEELW